MKRSLIWFGVVGSALALAVAGGALALTPRVIPTPERTAWKPVGCRVAPSADPAFVDRRAYRNLHADAWNSAEVSLALAPELGVDWTAETDKWTPTGPSFDRAGNLYFSPFWSGEPVVLISLDPRDGSRRFAIPGDAPSGSSPLVAPDPDDATQDVIYLPLYEEAIAVRPDGTVLWRKPSGLVAPPGADLPPFSFGINLLAQRDALIADTSDGHLYALDRRTGATLLAAPYELPGEKAPPATFTHLSPPLVTAINAELQPLFGGAPASLGWNELVDTLLGGSTEVANFFSIDPATGRIWVAATAPDDADGAIDGVSEYGALYGLDLVGAAPPYAIVEACHVYFAGGSASTPALRADGARIYLGDSATSLHAYDASCNELWQLDVGYQINGAIGVSSDGGELYVSTNRALVKVVDRGASGEKVWESTYDMYDLAAGETAFHLLLPAIGANGLLAQAGAGLRLNGTPIPLRVGYAHVDRETGHLRSYVEGPEESVAVSATGPDGGVYLGNSPIRRAVARGLFPSTTAPLIGGITKYGPRRQDLLLRDALCASGDRAQNAARNRKRCGPAAFGADLRQLGDLVAESRAAADAARQAGEIDRRLRDKLEPRLARAEARLGKGQAPSSALRGMCALVDRSVAP